MQVSDFKPDLTSCPCTNVKIFRPLHSSSEDLSYIPVYKLGL